MFVLQIDTDFIGGNIRVLETGSDTVQVASDLRDTDGDWFYWAFRVTGAAGRTLTFCFDDESGPRVGYFGPAVSCDFISWSWLGKQKNHKSFTYCFGETEDSVYFAHSMPYHPARFFAFAQKHKLSISDLCETLKGRKTPCITFGTGDKTIFLTARHHACESTGNFVLEGFLEEYINAPIPGTRIFCVPFVDFDGVLDGDQGKNRRPHDHNRDYGRNHVVVHSSCAAIRKAVDSAAEKGEILGFDFHSPWHFGGRNDKVFIVKQESNPGGREERFAALLEESLLPGAMRYERENDILPGVEWHTMSGLTFAEYIIGAGGFGFTLETPYFGEKGNEFSQTAAVKLGQSFASALRKLLIYY